VIEFPLSGVETYWWLPLVVAFSISCVTSTAGLSGAFLLLPFQVSVLGFASPAVTPTNLLFSVIAAPSGVYRFCCEKRMVWPLVWTIALGSLPGLLLGIFIRVRYLPDPRAFKLFVGLVLIYIAARLLPDAIRSADKPKMKNTNSKLFEVAPLAFNLRHIIYRFENREYQASTPAIFVLSVVVGIICGIYGIGGAAILAPVLVTIFRLPVHAVAGAALCGTFLNSTVGVLFYILIAPVFAGGEIAVQPDWHLGIMFGIGGSAGIYLGARIQRFLPARLIKLILGLIMLFISGRYIIEFFV